MMTELTERLTLRLPKPLHEHLTIRAKEQQRSLNNLIVFLLTEAQRQARRPPPPPFPNVTGATATELTDAIADRLADAASLPPAPDS
jgi:hypothetical protein